MADPHAPITFTEASGRNEVQAAQGLRELARIHQATGQARAELGRLQAQVVQTQIRLDANHPASLLEANEQLVLAALQSRGETEVAERALQLAARAAVLTALEDLRHHPAVVGVDPGAPQQLLLQDPLREANENLILAAISAQELQAAAEQAQHRQSEFLAVVAHELRHPLAPIRNAAAILGRIAAKEPLLARMQALIERQVVHMSRLVSDLLDVSRVHTGKLRLERSVVDMTALIEGAAEGCRPTMEARHQIFSVQMPSCALALEGDPVRLAQVLSNLLDNASKYTPEAGHIALAVEVAAEVLVMTVSDDGIGISAQALGKVFEPFVQEAEATVFNGGGLGIGLTVVRELVEAHGGTVEARSAGSGCGSQFVVTLPLTRQAHPMQ